MELDYIVMNRLCKRDEKGWHEKKRREIREYDWLK